MSLEFQGVAHKPLTYSVSFSDNLRGPGLSGRLLTLRRNNSERQGEEENSARGRTRTGTELPPRDFKSLVSTNSTTRAWILRKNGGWSGSKNASQYYGEGATHVKSFGQSVQKSLQVTGQPPDKGFRNLKHKRLITFCNIEYCFYFARHIT